MAEGAAVQTIKVKTTLPARPLPSNAERPHVHTERLVLRPYTQDDLEGYHAIRTHPEVMKYSAQGRPNKDLAESQTALNAFLPPHDTEVHNYVVALATTGEFIGSGGVLKQETFMGWPEVGYSIRYEYWKLGYATEYLRAFVEAWWKLPRQAVEIEIDPRTVPDATGGDSGMKEVPEQLVALINMDNKGSQRVLEKCGFRLITEWLEANNRKGCEGLYITVGLYAISKPKGT